MTLPAKKSELRAIFRSLLASIEPETAETWSIAVCNHLQRWTEHQGQTRYLQPTGKEERRGEAGDGGADGGGRRGGCFWVCGSAARRKSSGGMGGRGKGKGVVAVPRWIGWGVMSAVAIRDWSRIWL